MIHENLNKIIVGDALETLKQFPANSIDCVITSPPYYALRDYQCQGQMGLESDLSIYLNNLLETFDEVYRVLKKDGTCWVNLGDTYSSRYKGTGGTGQMGDGAFARLSKRATFNLERFQTGLPDKCLCQIPSRFAIGMTDRGWILRNEIIWHKPNCIPSSAKDRFTVDFEKIFFFSKSQKYYFYPQYEKSKEGLGRRYRFSTDKRFGGSQVIGNSANREREYVATGKRMKRATWKVATKSFTGAHFAVYPEDLIKPCIVSGCPPEGIVLDPFMGAGTTGLVARKNNRNFIGIDISNEYAELAMKRIKEALPLLSL
jgi:DNA modification methylase